MLGTHPGVLLLGAPAIGSEPCHYAHDLNPEIPLLLQCCLFMPETILSWRTHRSHPEN